MQSGKSTTTGRLLFELGGIPERELEKLKVRSADRTGVRHGDLHEAVAAIAEARRGSLRISSAQIARLADIGPKQRQYQHILLPAAGG